MLCDTDCQRGLHDHAYIVGFASPHDVVACGERGNTGMQCYADAIALIASAWHAADTEIAVPSKTGNSKTVVSGQHGVMLHTLGIGHTIRA